MYLTEDVAKRAFGKISMGRRDHVPFIKDGAPSPKMSGALRAEPLEETDPCHSWNLGTHCPGPPQVSTPYLPAYSFTATVVIEGGACTLCATKPDSVCCGPGSSLCDANSAGTQSA